jgi:hypothetical protein
MDDPAANGQSPPPVDQRSPADLIKLRFAQVSALIHDELKLAERKMARTGKTAAPGVGALGGSGVVAAFGSECLIACAILALSPAVAAWLAALIVGAALVGVAGATALPGADHLRRATPPLPIQDLAGGKADLEEFTERARR